MISSFTTVRVNVLGDTFKVIETPMVIRDAKRKLHAVPGGKDGIADGGTRIDVMRERDKQIPIVVRMREVGVRTNIRITCRKSAEPLRCYATATHMGAAI